MAENGRTKVVDRVVAVGGDQHDVTRRARSSPGMYHWPKGKGFASARGPLNTGNDEVPGAAKSLRL